ncbi:transporter family-2 protein [Peptoclostridium litorale DSM 5388]|uniref:Membrane-spanning protein n=1 Tax=Peptoclostridium litorale DSM 5388 TaxID=1121324 RepID=A0A069RF65_PEPLI|nr:DMT family transporter [Peptoclostridium litorale]KDR95636.1 hypothetical protein CLIT_10c03630 [Peptoclostridium litorale DSM 5388]SIN99930.1 transporter family-2 protein [Peptoclostridium litorale DSM 5388]
MNNLISTFIGALISFMILVNGILSDSIGNYSSSVIIHLVGLVSVLIVLAACRSKISIQKGIPLYMYSAGALGVFTVLFSNLSFTQLGVSLTLALGLLGQSISSIVIDHFGLLGMDTVKFKSKKYIGLLLISLGIFVMAAY